jgi:hypothetical protein
MRKIIKVFLGRCEKTGVAGKNMKKPADSLFADWLLEEKSI